MFKVKNSNAPWALIGVFSLLIAAIVFTGFLYYRHKDGEIRDDAYKNLAAIARLKVGQIEHWRSEREGDALIIQNSDAIAREARDFFYGRRNKDSLLRWLAPFCLHNGYSGATLYDDEGTLRLDYGESGGGIGAQASGRLKEVIKEQKVAISALHISSATGKATIGVLVPLLLQGEKDHRTAGVLFLRIDPYRVLYPLIQSWPTPSDTAETLIVRRVGDDVLFLNELRHKKDTALKLRLPVTREYLPAAMAVTGREGTVEGLDYRGVPVLASIHRVPDSPWYMIAKIDRAEVFAARHQLMLLIMLVTILLVVAAGAIVGLWWRHERAVFYRGQYRAEIERRALASHLNYLVKYANDMIFLFSPRENIREVNDRACLNYGYEREELLQLHISALRPPELRSGMSDILVDIKGSEGLIYETIHMRKDGTRFPVEVSARAFDVEGNRFIQAIIRDITERKEAEKTLQDSEERFRRIFQESPIGLATSGDDFRFVKANAVFCKMFGYSEEELTDLTFRELTHPDHLSADSANIERLMRNELPFYQTEKRYVRKDGAVIWGDLKVSVLRDAEGKFHNFLVMIEEITEHKLAENNLAIEKERLAVTLRSIGDGVITTDLDGKVTLVNKVAEELTGWSFAEASGQPLSRVFNIINEQTRERCENPVDKVLQSGLVIGLANHTALISRDGRELIIADSGAPIRDSESRIIGVVLVFRDITEKQKTDLALQNADKLEAIGALAGGIAHDFNNLLGGIFGYLELIRLRSENGDYRGVEDYLSKAFGVYDRAKHLTQQLLVFSKGGSPLLKTQYIAGEVQKAVSFALSGSNISPLYNIAPDLWPCDFDENQMAQVIDNIVINARQAMPLGGNLVVTMANIAPSNVPAVLPVGKYVRISISDSGSGIMKEHLSRIFDPFFTTKQQGSGLGLATSYSIVKKHGGVIEVDSELGRGSSFHIYLPASESQIAVAEEESVDLHYGQGKILVMDDEEFILDVALQMLRTMGYEAVTALNGDEAAACVKKAMAAGEPFKAAILDLTIPGGKGGRETVHILKDIDPLIRIAASSGYSEDPIMAKPADYGFAGRLIKPYRREDMAILLKTLFA